MFIYALLEEKVLASTTYQLAKCLAWKMLKVLVRICLPTLPIPFFFDKYKQCAPPTHNSRRQK